MKYELFKNIIQKATEETPNICVAFNHGYWGDDIPDNIANNIEKVISFLQSKVGKGYFCKKDEFLIIYDGEALISNINNLFSLNIVVNPTNQIDDLNTCIGEDLQLIVNSLTGEIGNNSYGFAQLGLSTEAGEEEPVIYGSYKDCSFDINYFIRDMYDFWFKEEKVAPICFSYQPKERTEIKSFKDNMALLTPESSTHSIRVL